MPRTNLRIASAALLLVGALLFSTGCLETFKSPAAKDAAVALLEDQVNDQKTVLDDLFDQLQAMALATANSQNLSDEDRVKLAEDLASIEAKIAEGQASYGPLVESLLTARDKPTAGEAFGDIGAAASSLLPYPFNLVGGLLVTGLLGAGGMKRRKDGQLSAVVESIASSGTSDGNGNIILDKKKLGDYQQRAGVQTLVEKIRKNLDVRAVKRGEIRLGAGDALGEMLKDRMDEINEKT